MKITLTTLAAALVATPLIAGEVTPASVTFGEYGEIEQSLTGQPGDPESGALVMKNKSIGNCVACHQISALDDTPFQGEIGPALDGAGDRWEEADLRGIVANAKQMFPGTIMPAYFKTEGFERPGNAYTGKAPEGDLDPLLTAQQIEDVVAFLVAQKEQ